MAVDPLSVEDPLVGVGDGVASELSSLTDDRERVAGVGGGCGLQFQIFGALAEFERGLIRERTRAGLAAARARGRLGGRPLIVTPEKLSAARLMREQKHTMNEIARVLGVSRATLYRHLALSEATEPGERAA